MSYKTLILIDNSSELESYNQDTIKETVKYFISNIKEDDMVAVAVTGEKPEYLTEYDDSLNTQLKAIDGLSFCKDVTPGTDVLMDVILEWKNDDLAYRDIVFISAKGLSAGSEYTKEELFFEINNKQYPIYTLSCAQNGNSDCIKGLSSLSRISGGISICTEDTEYDAEVEKQLAKKLLAAMQDKRDEEEALYVKETEERLMDSASGYSEELSPQLEVVEAEIIDESDTTDGNEYPGGVNTMEADSNIIYEKPAPNGFFYDNKKTGMLAVMILIPFLVVILGLVLRKRKYKRDDERFRESLEKQNRTKKEEQKRLPFMDEYESDTISLSSITEEQDTGTRLLYQTREGLEITLEDRANPTKYYRACVRDTIVIGRSEKSCDISINYDDSISSRHCELFLRDGNLYCRDLGSSNGTMINQHKVYQETKVESGDILRIGRLSFFIQIVGGSYE